VVGMAGLACKGTGSVVGGWGDVHAEIMWRTPEGEMRRTRFCG
jgi:hypothetical protein